MEVKTVNWRDWTHGGEDHAILSNHPTLAFSHRVQKSVLCICAKTLDGSTLTVALEGMLNTTAAPELEESLHESLDGVTELIFDLENLQYITSAGLRVVLAAQKVMNKQGSMKVRNVNAEIMGIFDMTGFSDWMTFE